MRRLLLILAVVVAVAIVLYMVGQSFVAKQVSEPTPGTWEQGLPTSPSVRASGVVVPVRWMDLSFRTGGVVGEVLVKEGDTVQAGQVLARLVTDDLQREVDAAADALAIQEAQYAQAMATPTPLDLTVAQATLDSAKANLAELEAGPSPRDVERYKLQWDQAKNSLWAAQAERDGIAGSESPDYVVQGANARVASAEISVRLAELAYQEALEGPSPAALASARAAVAQAQAALDRLKQGPTAEEKTIAEAQLRQARQRLEAAKAALAAAELVAPFDGTITALHLRPGQMISPGQAAMTLADLTEFEVETTDLDEWDLSQIHLDQGVTLTLPGLGNRLLRGRLVYIAPAGSTLPSGDVVFKARIALDRQEQGLRWGMSARIEFIVTGLK
ncbi:MAG: efflux RND transporter periplasmic adaptor subunit [Chloroflexi bacterium]|nr:efflux RND transporter periplasmic adaptor subunit [Chloroflexota bacterium]